MNEYQEGEKFMAKLYKSECYCTNLRRCANAISDFYDRELKETGITISQYYLLINLKRLKNVNITHWAEYVGLDRSTMVRNIKVLESRGFIERTEGHGKTFALSEVGEKTLDTAIPIWEKAQKKIEVFLGKEDSKAILRIGCKLQNLEKIDLDGDKNGIDK